MSGCDRLVYEAPAGSEGRVKWVRYEFAKCACDPSCEDDPDCLCDHGEDDPCCSETETPTEEEGTE